MDDSRAWRYDAQPVERRLRPAKELVALRIALVLAGDVIEERLRGAIHVDLYGVVDDQVGGHQGVDLARVAPELGHRVPHRGEIHDGRHAGEVLEDHPRGQERDLGLGCLPRPP